jgi:hypothetical protein
MTVNSNTGRGSLGQDDPLRAGTCLDPHVNAPRLRVHMLADITASPERMGLADRACLSSDGSTRASRQKFATATTLIRLMSSRYQT